MAAPGGDFFADLTTAPIFDDCLYQTEALLLSATENEHDLDAQLIVSARKSAIDDPYRILCPDAHLPESMSMLSLQSEQGSSMSMHSQETQSTNFTSLTSRTSRDPPYVEQQFIPYVEQRFVQPSPPALARASLSQDRHTATDSPLPGIRHRHSSSAYSAADSILSTTSSARKPSTRKHKRGSGLFSMFRKDSSASSSPRHYPSKPQSPSLEPGHSLSQYALRLHARGALDDRDNVSPTRPSMDTTLVNYDIVSVTNSALTSPGSRSLRDSGYSEDGISTVDLSNSLESSKGRETSLPTPVRAISRDGLENLNLALEDEAFKSMMEEHRQQLQRVSLFESNQRKALLSYHQWSMKRLSSQLEVSKAERIKQFPLELERLDEFQINAEHDLRKAHALETQNVATALKYMDAYCCSTSSSHPELSHVVTEEDRNKLERQRVAQAKLPAKHESAINVLRAKQERDTKLKLQKQQADLESLGEQYEKDRKTEEQQYTKDCSRLDRTIQARRERILHRWDLKTEIWRKDWESQHDTILNGLLPQMDWPEGPDANVPISPSSFLALYTQVAA